MSEVRSNYRLQDIQLRQREVGELETWRAGMWIRQFTNSPSHQWLFEKTADAQCVGLRDCLGRPTFTPSLRAASEGGTPGSKFAGGHRIRVTPVPIPNTEVKPDTADGTAWETVWESRSLPALISQGPMSDDVGL